MTEKDKEINELLMTIEAQKKEIAEQKRIIAGMESPFLAGEIAGIEVVISRMTDFMNDMIALCDEARADIAANEGENSLIDARNGAER